MISTTIDEVFTLTEQIGLFQQESDINNFNEANSLSVSFIERYKKLKKEQPYHINVIDLLRANENAHSRILLHLLKQNVNGKYEILESFLHTLFPKFNHTIEKPQLTSEKHRIDLLVQERGKYAIIFENKIHDAVIQKNQIARYIDKMKGLGYSEKQIYVLYLPPNDSNHPNDCCWKLEQSHCKECDRINVHSKCIEGESYLPAFEERYSHLTFRDNIIPWLKSDVLPNCRIKDSYLQSTVVQYIDHLEGLFDIREINKKMNMELQDYIKQTLKFEEKPEHNLVLVKSKIDDLNKVINQLNSLKERTENDCWELWQNQLRTDFPHYKVIDCKDESKKNILRKVGVIIETNGLKFSVLIEKEVNIYYGIGRHYSSETIITDVSDLVAPVLDELSGFERTEWWYGWKYTSFENGYMRLKALIKEVEKSCMV